MKIVSYGGGTNSTAMLIGLHERGERPDAILMADTGGEMPHTYAYIEVMNQWLESVGFPLLTVVRDANKTLEEDCIGRNALPSITYGGFKTCSQRFKIQPQTKWLNNWGPAKEVWAKSEVITKLIGFDFDEPQRANPFSDKKTVNEYPLIEWEWGREECIQAIARAGLPQPGKSSCFFCPNMRPSEIMRTAEQYPELGGRIIAMESNANLDKLKGLGRTWAWSDLLKQGDMLGFPDIDHDAPCGCYDGD